jgi:site-specific DNA-adenine methylase
MIMLQQVVSSHIVDRLADDSDKTPVIETLLLNKVMRQALFSSYLEMIEVKDSSFDLLASPKTLVYLDPGLDVSLDRYNSNPERPMVNDQVIELTHSQQELPVASELPNLEVVIPHSESEIADFIAKA